MRKPTCFWKFLRMTGTSDSCYTSSGTDNRSELVIFILFYFLFYYYYQFRSLPLQTLQTQVNL